MTGGFPRRGRPARTANRWVLPRLAAAPRSARTCVPMELVSDIHLSGDYGLTVNCDQRSGAGRRSRETHHGVEATLRYVSK